MVYRIPAVNLVGRGCLAQLKDEIGTLGCKKALVVSDKFLTENGVVEKVTKVLDQVGIEHTLYNDVKQNPSVANVEGGLEVLKKENCDFIVSIGGGSPQDCGKAISVLATNGGKITDYEGVNKSQKKCLPIVAIATTAGTSAEVTINYVISKPAGLTAATGMDALTHAMEAVVANGAIDVTDATALYAIKQIFEYLPRAVENGQDIEAREQMCYACFLNGIAFSNAGLGNVHAMAHQLGGLYDLPHGVCNAMLLPIVEEENAKQAPAKFRVMAETIGMDVEGKTDEECMDFVIGKIKELSERVGIPKTLSELGVENPDFETLAENSMKDACAGANPVFFDKELLIKLFKKIA